MFFLLIDLLLLPFWNSSIRSELQQPYCDLEEGTNQDGKAERMREPGSLVTS